VIRNCNSLQRLRLFAASALPCLLLCLPFLCLPLGFLVIGEKALAAESPESLVSKFSGALPEGATVTTTSKNVANYKLLVSAAEKVKRELRATETIQVAGLRTRTLWQLPSGAELDEVFAAVSAQMEGEELFSCSGRDCGRSTAWSTLVFSEALVYGQDRNQRYRVVRQSAAEVAAVYVIRRGNRRVNLLLETLLLGGPTDAPDAKDATKNVLAESTGLTGEAARAALVQTGVARLAVIPGEAGELDAEAVEMLKQTGTALAALPAGKVYVVCHLYTGSDVEQLLAQSEVCAADASAILQSALNESVNTGLEFEVFAAGPLLPRELPRELPRDTFSSSNKRQTNRIELVQPNSLPGSE